VADDKQKLLIAQLQNELLKLENKMLLAGGARHQSSDALSDSSD